MKPKWGVSITWLGHATVLYRSEKGTTVLADAWVDGNPACPEAAKDLRSVDLLLVTHGHFDHFGDCVAVIKKYDPDVICVFEIAQYLESRGAKKLHGMNKGGTQHLRGIHVTMVHAVHSSTIADGDRLVPAGDACGYVIEFENGTRVYHAGDTAIFGDMRLIGDLYRPSIAVLPIGDLFTMSPLEAAAGAKMLGVRSVVPIHHSTFPALTGTPDALRKHLEGSGIEVLELKPGETV